jgi:hypothetical protein
VTSEEANAASDEQKPAVTLRRGRLTIVVVAFAAVLFAIGALITAVVIGQPIGFNRDDPNVVVRDFVQAAAVDHDVTRTQALLCGSGWTAQQVIQELTVTSDPTVITTWRILSTTVTGDSAESVVRITSAVDVYNDVRVWRFELRHSNSWHVCSGKADPTPSPSATPSLTPQ